jgi:hypothetical protein
MAQRSRGNPTKFNTETTGKVLKALESGASYTLACRMAGIDYVTWRNWIVKAENELDRLENDPTSEIDIKLMPYVELYYAAKEATNKADQITLDSISKMQRRSLRAAIFMLKMRYPDLIEDTNKIELTGANGGPVLTGNISITDSERKELLSVIAELGLLNDPKQD